MKGSTHLAIGAAIGTAAALFFPFQPEHAALYLSVSTFSALAADLDGTSLLNGKLGQVSRWLRGSGLWIGLLLVFANSYLYVTEDRFYPSFAAISVTILLLGLVTSQGTIRNALVSLIGIGLLYAGWQTHQTWLLELGAFVAWVPWLKHRGMTHTVWALVLWGQIGWELQYQLKIDGIMATAIAGYASHLLADSLTPQGVKCFYPLIKKSIKLIPR
ncbi:metal-dependent hydrolase [Cohnella sp. CFH 77786]|uniref:metal-dependent hydrolase n=1 Tax=Cohnella sp. CFH 77786 TaxID=2662265 RepID=UPI001C608FF1|nr:metal-dependent hydrolase [Cohnella sp. CFH 77786]MBW5446426.1 metal-dependent hydrolase [Cohnella sp. CFH 77786]